MAGEPANEKNTTFVGLYHLYRRIEETREEDSDRSMQFKSTTAKDKKDLQRDIWKQVCERLLRSVLANGSFHHHW